VKRRVPGRAPPEQAGARRRAARAAGSLGDGATAGRLLRAWPLWIALALAALAVWWLWPARRAANLILISVDTLRADRLACYGYSGNETPHFDRWAGEGFLFTHAFSEYPLTLPAHVTMLTGQLPLHHGVRENAGYKLGQDETTLAEVLKSSGYRTAAFIGAYVLASEFGVSQGFDTFDQAFATSIETVGASAELQRPAPAVTSPFLRWLAAHEDRPFFAFVHFFDVHLPRPGGYDAAVSRVDESLGEIDAFLRRRGLLETTAIILTADHGESLGKHDEAGHGFFVYDSSLQVPLIFRPPGSHGKRGVRIDDAVSLADVTPTILDTLGAEIPASVDGRSLRPLLRGDRLAEPELYAECFVPELHFRWSPLESLRFGEYKYIEAPRPELYDVAKDPGELRNLCAERPALAEEYHRKLVSFVERHAGQGRAQGSQPADPDTLRKLMTLGYVSPGSARSSPDLAAPVDPKDRIEVFERYHEILNLLANDRPYPTMLQDLERLSAAAPELRGVAYLRAWALELAGKLEPARDSYRLALQEQPDNTMARARYASLLLELHEVDEAERQFKEVLKSAPGDYRTRNNLAGLYRATGRRELAVQEVRTVTEMRPHYATAWLNLGHLQAEAGRWNEAEEAFLRVVQIDPMNAAGHQGLAYALRAQGRPVEAAREEEKAERLDLRLRHH
jgi:arylsulfatase A-like enzyme/Flp pilus assembly protein TadD